MYLFLHYFVSKREPYGIIYDLFTKYLMIIYTVFPVICLTINVGGVMASRVRLIALCKVHSFRGSFSTPSHFAQNFKNWCFGVIFSRLFPALIMPFNSRRDGRAPRRRGVAAPSHSHRTRNESSSRLPEPPATATAVRKGAARLPFPCTATSVVSRDGLHGAASVVPRRADTQPDIHRISMTRDSSRSYSIPFRTLTFCCYFYILLLFV